MIEQGADFHGHLGSFLVLGIRMGRLALKKLNSPGYESIEALVKTGTTPSLSCLADGIQISTGCTLGKGNIATEPLSIPEADFTSDGKSLTFRVRDDIMDVIETWKDSYATLEDIAHRA